jgi:hypothetical protein
MRRMSVRSLDTLFRYARHPQQCPLSYDCCHDPIIFSVFRPVPRDFIASMILLEPHVRFDYDQLPHLARLEWSLCEWQAKYMDISTVLVSV